MADRIVTAGEDDGTPPELLLLAPPDMPMPGWFRRPDGRYERILLPLQRFDWPRFEPAPEPDPFGRHLWGLAQLLSWVYVRNRAVVRDASPQGVFESELTRKALRDLGRNGACYRTFEEAEDAVMVELQTGRLPSTGLANDEGDRKEIPSLLWVDREFSEDLLSAKPKDFSRTTATVLRNLRFPREDVLPIWPDPLESLAMADEQKASTTADGNANVGRRAHNKREDLFRSGPPAPAESESHNSAPPSELASRSGAGLATKRWSEAKQKREPVLVDAESVARERWKHCDDDHAEMTFWLQNEYVRGEKKALPFVDDTLTKYLLQRMAKVAREIGKPIKGEKASSG